MKKIWGQFFFGLLLYLVFIFDARPDGLEHWVKVAQTPYGTFTGVTYGDGAFVAVSTIFSSFPGGTNGGISSSVDGVHWTNQPFFPDFTSVAFGNGRFVAAGGDFVTDNDAGIIYYSTDGLDWSGHDGGAGIIAGPGMEGVVFGNGLFVAVGYWYEGATGAVFTSTDGQQWAEQSAGTTNMLHSVAFGGGQFAAVGGPDAYYGPALTGEVIFSSDGTNWVNPSANPFYHQPFVSPLQNVTFHRSSLFPAAGAFIVANGGKSLTAAAGGSFSTWTRIPETPFPAGPIASLNGISIGAGTNGAILSSTDEINWIQRATGIPNPVKFVAAGGSAFVAFTQDGSIYATVPTLTAQPVSGNGGLQLTITGGVGSTLRLQASVDLQHWLDLVTFTNPPATTQYFDPGATSFPRRFYRAVSP